MSKLHIRASRERLFEGIGIFIFEQDKENRKFFRGELTFKEVPDGGSFESTLFLPNLDLQAGNTAQVLMDDLWECGIRPSEGQGSAGQLKAVQDHLGDMRKITFHKLNMGVKIE